MALLSSYSGKPRSAGRDRRPVRPERNRKMDRTRKAPPPKIDPFEPIEASDAVPGEPGGVTVWFSG